MLGLRGQRGRARLVDQVPGDVAHRGRRLLDRINKGEVPNPFTSSWLTKRGWSGLTTKEDIERAVATLERCHITRTRERETTGLGGRPTEDHYINPAVLADANEKAVE